MLDLKANWIWRKMSGLPYNDTVIAKKDVLVSAELEESIISISADSLYRLFINDIWVNDGPARGWPEHYYCDQIDVTKYLKHGENEIKVIANHYGVGHFHGMPQQPGLLVQLDTVYVGGSKDSVITDQSWQVSKASAWERNTPKISCQMSPAEYYKAQFEDKLEFDDAEIVCSANDGPWGDIKPRDVALLTRIPTNFESFVGANILERAANQKVVCLPWCKLIYPGLVQANRKIMPAFALISILEMKETGTFNITAKDYRGDNYPIYIDGQKGCNGEYRLSAGKHIVLFAHGLSLNHTTDVVLNISSKVEHDLINAYDPAFENSWTLIEFEEYKFVGDDMDWAKDPEPLQKCIAGYKETIEKKSAITDVNELVSQTSSKAKQLPADKMFALDGYEKFLSRKVMASADSNVENPTAILTGEGEVGIQPSPDGDVELVYDLGKQNIGFYSFKLEAEAGVEVSIYGVEYIDDKGNVQYPDDHRNGMTYITKAGLNEFTSLKRRSGRYLYVRFSNQSEPIKLKEFKLIESTYPVEYKGSFQCSDENLNNVWDISAHTLKLCMEDTFTDCPLYEQTLWVGDARNESVLAYGIFGAENIAKRCILLAAQSLERFPMVGCQLPSSWHCILPAWSFLWGISVWDYYWYTKDKQFLAEIWLYVEKNLKGAGEYINEDGLFSADFWNLFDWAGIDQDHETVFHSSMFMVGAINAAIKCGKVIDQDITWLEEMNASLKQSINKYYDADKKSYPDSIHENGSVSSSTSQHTSFLAMLYDIAQEENKTTLIDNVITPPDEMVKVGSPFAIFFMFEMLDKLEKSDFIISSIYDNYLPMIKAGATTVWETFATGTLGQGGFPTRSHCHAWSSAPLYFLSRITLGIRQTSAGCESFDISPYVADLDWAKGSFATPLGNVNVSWQKSGDKLDIHVSTPKGIEIEFKENESLDAFEVTFDRTTE